MRPTVLLFDIDGTLVTTPGCGRIALERAFVARYGRSDVLRGIRFGGMTDPAIVRMGLTALGEPAAGPAADETIRAILADYVPLLEEELAGSPDFGLHPGVEAVLAAVASCPGIAVGLGTGNIRPGAKAKLARVGLDGRFEFGGFGCDHEDRAEILRVGATRGAALVGVPVDAVRLVVIGDTPRDVAAAQAIGAESVAVGTCGFTPAALRGSGATHAFADLADPRVLDVLVGSNPRRSLGARS